MWTPLPASPLPGGRSLGGASPAILTALVHRPVPCTTSRRPHTVPSPLPGGRSYLNSSPLFRGEAGRGVDRAPAVRCGSSRARPRRSPEPRDSRSGSPCIPVVRAGPFAPRPLPAVRRVARHRFPRPDADGDRRSRRCVHRWEIDAGSGNHPAVAREAASTNDARPTSARCATAWRARVCSCGPPPPGLPPGRGEELRWGLFPGKGEFRWASLCEGVEYGGFSLAGGGGGAGSIGKPCRERAGGRAR